MYKMSQWRSGKSGIEAASRRRFANEANKSLGAVFKLTKEPENLRGLPSELSPVVGGAFPGMGLYFGVAISL